MELALVVYLVNVFDSIRSTLPLLLIVSIVLLVITTHPDVKNGTAITLVKVSIFLVVMITGVRVFVPDQKTSWMMVGAYATQKVAESGTMQESSAKVIKLINAKLDSLIEDTKSKKD